MAGESAERSSSNIWTRSALDNTTVRNTIIGGQYGGGGVVLVQVEVVGQVVQEQLNLFLKHLAAQRLNFLLLMLVKFQQQEQRQHKCQIQFLYL